MTNMNHVDAVLDAALAWAEAVQTRDTQQVLQLYARDAVLWGTVSKTRRDTPDAIAAYFDHFLSHPDLRAEFLDPYVRFVGDNVAINSGAYRFSWSEPDTTVLARYSFVYRRDGDRWMIVDHHSSAVPENGIE